MRNGHPVGRLRVQLASAGLLLCAAGTVLVLVFNPVAFVLVLLGICAILALIGIVIGIREEKTTRN